MARFVIGVLVGAVLLGGGALFWLRRGGACYGRCGAGTICRTEKCVPAVQPPPVVVKESKRRRRHTGGSTAAPEVQLRPGDEKVVAQGDALGRPEHIDLSQPDGRELSQDDLDRVFRTANPQILRCISDAIGDAPLETGRVDVGLRIERTGAVSRVRVEAPQLMQRNGLTRCVRSAVTALHFAGSGGASVVTYPFELK